ncbi:MAG: amino acid--tRNA ligase-related protein, partial [Polyangiales bacterium]
DRFEAFFRGVELCNGFGELTDAMEQRRRFDRDQVERRAAGLPVYPIDERFLADLERGMPESGGNALGVDRLLMLLLRAASIQAVMPFPAERL